MWLLNKTSTTRWWQQIVSPSCHYGKNYVRQKQCYCSIIEKNCIMLNSWLLNLSFNKKQSCLLFWTYYFAKIDLWSTVIGDSTGTVSHSVRGGMCWNKLLRPKGFVFTLLTRSLKGERRVLHCKYNNKINLFHRKWSIHSPKQTKQDRTWIWIWH